MEIIGYFKEYYVNNKFIGTEMINYEDRKIGYEGRKTEVLSKEIILQNKKKIKQGIEVLTIIYPLTK